MANKPLKRNLHQHVVDSLGSQIIQGKFAEGHTLPTADHLSAEMGVSRTVTREAIKVLEEKGLLHSRPKAGIQVLPQSEWKLLDADVMKWHYTADNRGDFWRNLMEVRLVIEPMAAELAAQRATDEEVARIQTAYNALESLVDDLEPYKAADRDYHAAIFEATHNPLLIHLARTVNVDLDAGRNITGTVSRSMREILPIHKRLLDAITRHDAADARATGYELVRQVAVFVEEALRDE